MRTQGKPRRAWWLFAALVGCSDGEVASLGEGGLDAATDGAHDAGGDPWDDHQAPTDQAPTDQPLPDGGTLDVLRPDVVDDLPPGAPPRAAFRVTPARVRRGTRTTVTLDGTLSAGTGLGYRWSLGAAGPGMGALTDPRVSVDVTPAADLALALTVTNPAGSDTATGIVRVDDPPRVDPGPDRAVLVGEAVSLDGSGTVDPQGDPVAFVWRVSTTPTGGQATLTGETTATPRFTADTPGTYTLTLRAADPLGPGPEASVRVRVFTRALDPPTVTVSATPPSVAVGSEVTLAVGAMGTAPLTATTLTVQGAPVTLDGTGRARFRPPAPGDYALVAVATDANGQSAEARSRFTAHAAGATDNGPPVVALTAPADGAVVAAGVPITGTARDTDLARYFVELSPRGLNQWTLVATGTASVNAATLGTLDPTRVTPGTYDLRLRAVDTFGRAATTPTRVVVIDLVGEVGALRFSGTDLALPLVGVPIRVSRTYDSHETRVGDFGPRWSMGVGAVDRMERPNVPGEGWRFSGDCVRTRTVTELRAHPVVFRVAGRAMVFRFAPEFVSCMGGGQNFRARFVPVGNVFGATLGGYGPGQTLFLTSGDDTLLVADGPGAGSVYDPRAFTLTLPDGRQYSLDLDRGLTAERDAHGNTVTITRTGITHSSGVAVTFTRDTAGRITAIARSDGARRTYAYNAAGDLVTATDWEGGRWTYLYAGAHRLARVLDPTGNPVATHAYDPEGELTAVTDALGRSVTYARDRAARTETLTDRAGARTVIAYNPRGQVLSVTGPSGATERSEYDPAGNPTASIDPLGNRTESTFDALGRELTRRLPTGVTQATTWDPRGNITSRTDGLGGRDSFGYDPRGSLVSITDPAGGTVTLTRDPRGALTSATRPGGAAWRLTPTREGWLQDLIDLRGHRHTLTLDRLGRPTEVQSDMGGMSLRAALGWTPSGRPSAHTAPNGMASTLGWDGAGRQVSVGHPVFGETRHVYDGTGTLAAVVAPGGGTRVWENDPEGRVTATTTGAGRRIVTVRDPAGRVTAVTGPDGAVTRTTWRMDGLRERQTAPNGAVTSWVYDRFGRVTSVRGPMGLSSGFAYDPLGRVTAVTDPAGIETVYTLDGRGDVTAVAVAGQRPSTRTWDGDRRLTAVGTPDGRVTRFVYEPGGELQRVTDPAGGTVGLAYGPMGLASVTDPNGRVRRYERDASGNITRVTLPGGASATLRYDPMTRTTVRTGYDGRSTTTLRQDLAGRVVAREASDGAAVGFTYDLDGFVTATRDLRGTTGLLRDPAGRLVTEVTPDGRTVRYDYDALGNVTRVSTPGGDRRYAYDPAGRLLEIVDPRGGRTTFGYDPGGRLASTAWPNGVTAQRTWNPRGMLAELSLRRGEAVLLRERYTYDEAGRLTRIEEDGGARTDYTYDLLDRLTGESAVAAGATRSTQYRYDPAGNLVRIEAPGGLRAFAVDPDDRVTTDGEATFRWDPEGRLVAIVGGPRAMTLRYDGLGHLVHVETTGAALGRHTVDYRYDAGGLLAARVADGVERRFLWDRSAALPHIVEESDATGAVVAMSTGAGSAGPLARHEGSAVRYLHGDRLGSLRAVTDEAGTVREAGRYTAWGEPLGGPAPTGAPRGFVGEWRDPVTGMYFLRARFYAPWLGRFTTPDPAPGDPRDPQSLHPYAYATDRPTMRVDPTGRTSFVGAMMSTALAMTRTLVSFTAAHPVFASAVTQAGALGLFYWSHQDAVASARPGFLSFQGAPSTLAVGAGFGTAWRRATYVSAAVGTEGLIWLPDARNPPPYRTASYAYYGYAFGGASLEALGVYAGAVWDAPTPGSYEGASVSLTSYLPVIVGIVAAHGSPEALLTAIPLTTWGVVTALAFSPASSVVGDDPRPRARGYHAQPYGVAVATGWTTALNWTAPLPNFFTYTSLTYNLLGQPQ